MTGIDPSRPASATSATPGRVVFVIRSLTIGGAGRQLIEIAAGLAAIGWSVDVVTFYPGGGLKPELDERGIRVRDLQKRGRWDLTSFARLARLLRRIDAPVVHAYSGEANLMVAVLKPLLRGSKVVWGIRASDLSRSRQDWLSSVLGWVNRRLARRADLIICNSRSGMELRLAEGYPRDRLVVVPNGIDVRRFTRDPVARDAVRAGWGVGEADILLGLVGRLDPVKGHDVLLRAVGPLLSTMAARLVLVGDGPDEYRAEMDAIARAEGIADRVVWAGPRTDMPAVYSALDLHVSASHGEGFPNAVAEAMACEVPCVVTDVGDSAELVGDTGWVCAPDDVEGLRTAITTALEARDGLQERGERARRRIVEQFDTDALVARTADLLSGGKAR